MNMPNELRAALRTAFFTFLGLFLASIAGWVQDVTEWVSTGGTDVFPDVTIVGKAAVSAAGAALAGLVNYAWLWLQAQGIPLPGQRPVYPQIEE
jgi:hypothetical protein